MGMWFEGRGDGRLLEVGWGWIGSLLDGVGVGRKKEGRAPKGPEEQVDGGTAEPKGGKVDRGGRIPTPAKGIGVGGIHFGLGVGTGYGGVGGARGGTS